MQLNNIPKIKVYTWEGVQTLINDLITILQEEGVKIDNIVGVPRGGLIPATMLSHALNKPFPKEIKDITANTLWVDDIIETGSTCKDMHIDESKLVVLVNKMGDDFKGISAETLPKDVWVLWPWENANKVKEDYEQYSSKRNI